MKISITYRLFFSILGATCLAILTLLVIMQWSINRGFIQYLGKIGQARLEQTAVELGREYGEKKSWDFLKTSPYPWDLRESNPPPDHDAGRLPGNEFRMNDHGTDFLPPPPPDARHRGGPLIILDENKKAVLGSYPADEKNINFIPILTNGKVVGYAGLLSPRHFLQAMQVQFLSQQKLALAFSAAGMVIIVVLISMPLARRLVKPIRAMARATHDISSGKYTTRISITSSDEFGQLAGDFNNMALTLEKHEKERRQWVADISHELRTPVAVLRGEIEALLDGIRATTPETIRSLHAETLRLSRLVEDLYQLSLSDIGALTCRKEDLDLVETLRAALEAHRTEFERKGVTLVSELPHGEKTLLFGDPERLNQLFANILENSLRYTDAGGRLVVSMVVGADDITLEFHDSEPGVPDGELGKLFDRLYRVEGSRSRSSGGAGLGLAISKNIVEAHEGVISAHPSTFGGLLVRISLPAAGRHA